MMIKAVPLFEYVPVYLCDEELQLQSEYCSIDEILADGTYIQLESSTILVCPETKRFQDENAQDYFSYENLRNENLLFVSVGVPALKRELITVDSRLVYPRNRTVALYALIAAQNKCEIDTTHPTFISKIRDLPYTEPHHLIPLAFADNFDVSLDVAENIVSLCSNCHNQIHYGKDIEPIHDSVYCVFCFRIYS